MRFRDHDAAEAGVLHKAIDALVAAHRDMRHHVDPQPRVFALADAAIEQVDALGNLFEQRIQRLVQDFQPGHLGVAQVDHDAGAIRRLDPRLPQGVAQPHRLFSRRIGRGIRHVGHIADACSFEGFAAINLSVTTFGAKALCYQ